MSSILGNSIRRLVNGSTESRLGSYDAEVLAICARKGGVGKTTTAVNLAAGAAMLQGRKVLLVDMDAQGHCASALHARLKGFTAEALGDILLGKRRDIQEIALTTSIPGLWVTPSDKGLSSAEGVMAGRIGKEFLLRSAIRVAKTHYDLIVIDCPPNLGSLTINALMASSRVLIPCDMNILALEGVDDIFEALETLEDTLGHHVDVAGVLRTRVDARNQKVNEAVGDALSSRYGQALLTTQIPINTKLSQAQLDGQPIFEFDRTCPGSLAYTSLVGELLGAF